MTKHGQQQQQQQNCRKKCKGLNLMVFWFILFSFLAIIKTYGIYMKASILPTLDQQQHNELIAPTIQEVTQVDASSSRSRLAEQIVDQSAPLDQDPVEDAKETTAKPAATAWKSLKRKRRPVFVPTLHQQNAPTTDPKERFHLLWGIHSTPDLLGSNNRQILRQTYLTGDDGICSWLEYMGKLSESPKRDEHAHAIDAEYASCRLFYVFVVGIDREAIDSPNSESDVIRTQIAENAKYIKQVFEWYQAAVKHPTTVYNGGIIFVGYTSDNTLLLSQVLLHQLVNLTSTYHNSMKEDNKDNSAQHILPSVQNVMVSTRFVQDNTDAHPRYWIFSRDVIKTIVTDECTSAVFHKISKELDPIKHGIKRMRRCVPSLTKHDTPWQFTQIASPAANLTEDWPSYRAYMQKHAAEAWKKSVTHLSAMHEFQNTRVAFVGIPEPSIPWNTLQSSLAPHEVHQSNNTNSTPHSKNDPKTSKVIHISARFGTNNKFYKQVQNMRKIIQQSKLFPDQHIFTYHSFPDFIMKDPRWSEHLQFLNTTASVKEAHLDPQSGARGGGYWFWKPVLIQHHLKSIDEGDWVVYADSDTDSHFHFLQNQLAAMKARGADFSMATCPFPETDWVKRDVYIEYCGEDYKDDRTFQYYAAFVMLRKTAATVQFIDEWVEGMSHYSWINDSPSVKYKEFATFKENRHDQTILSLLMKCRFGEPEKQEFSLGYAIMWYWKVYTFNLQKSKVVMSG